MDMALMLVSVDHDLVFDFGIFRFMYLEYQSQKGENTTRVVATDLPMILTVILYILVTMFIIYKSI